MITLFALSIVAFLSMAASALILVMTVPLNLCAKSPSWWVKVEEAGVYLLILSVFLWASYGMLYLYVGWV